MALRLEAMATGLEAMALGLEAMALRLEAIATMLEASTARFNVFFNQCAQCVFLFARSPPPLLYLIK